MANGIDPQVLGNLEGKLDMLIDAVSEVRKDQKEVAEKAIRLAVQMTYVDGLRDKVQDLERTRAYQAGWLACAGLLGGLGAWLINWLTRKV